MLSDNNAEYEKLFEEIYYSYYDKVLAVTLKFTKNKSFAGDVLQQIFMNLWKNKQLLRTINNIDAYLYKMVQNAIVDEIRKEGAHKVYLSETDHVYDTIKDSSGDVLIEKEMVMIINNVVNQMPKMQKRVYLLSREEGKSQREISEEMNISLATVKWHIAQAMQTIKVVLRKYI